jgi:hypothetical protein
VVVRGLPAIRNGAVFLQNGFPECVEMNSGVPAWRIHVPGQGLMEQGAKEFVWHGPEERLESHCCTVISVVEGDDAPLMVATIG